MAIRQTVKQKIYLTVGGLIMASIMELKGNIADNSRRISGLCNLNLETVEGEAAKERALNLLRTEQYSARNELQVALEAGEVSQVREISPMLS